MKTDETCRFEKRSAQKLNGSSIRPQLVGCQREFLLTLVGPERIRRHLEERRTADAHPEKNRSKDPAKPWISNRQLSVDSGLLPRPNFTQAPP